MSIDDNTGDTEYFASTDYNQRLEEKAESQYEQKDTAIEKLDAIGVDKNIDMLIAQNDMPALSRLANEELAEADYIKLIDLRNKDLHIQLARNRYITDAVAKRLIGTVYLAHKELLLNPSVSDESKNKLKERIKDNPAYADLL